MATPGPINSSEVEKARAEALHEINQTELALTDQLGKAARPVGQLGYEGAYNAGRRAEYIAILQENVGGFNAQANELAAAGDLQGLRALAEGMSQNGDRCSAWGSRFGHSSCHAHYYGEPPTPLEQHGVFLRGGCTRLID